ncbi:unnamed protein product [Trichogramma brassicae]|uniref:Uncharacterized protein n=1 Tax=Trichogramma brassicae TaxID=86971 RepID=A0A6H5ICQ3_9HYME|nr:unnamed protein product [Trichogramma brassicae]
MSLHSRTSGAGLWKIHTLLRARIFCCKRVSARRRMARMWMDACVKLARSRVCIKVTIIAYVAQLAPHTHTHTYNTPRQIQRL